MNKEYSESDSDHSGKNKEYSEALRRATGENFTYESDNSSSSDFVKPKVKAVAKSKIAAVGKSGHKKPVGSDKLDGLEDIESEQKLRDIYYNVSKGYQSAEKLYQKAKEENINVSRNDVRNWLKSSKTYSRFKPVKAGKSRKTIVDYLGEQLQLDLISMQKYKGKNGGYNWILSGIEILSR